MTMQETKELVHPYRNFLEIISFPFFLFLSLPLLLVSSPRVLFLACGFTALLLISNIYWGSRARLILLAFLTPFAAVFGPGALLVCSLIFICLEPQARQIRSFQWAWPLLLLVAIWVAFDAWNLAYLSINTWISVNSDGSLGFSDFLTWVRTTPPNGFHSLALFATFIVFLALYGLLVDSARREDFSKALLLGLIPASFLSVAQILGYGSGFFVNHNDFFASIGRFSGTFSDPNAFGVFAVLLLPLLMYQGLQRSGFVRYVLLASVVFWVALGVYSGSRSFFLGLIVYLFIILFSRGKIVASLSATVIVLLLLGINALPDQLTELSGIPVGVRRLLETLSLTNFEQAFFSRQVFFELNYVVWLNNPFFGIGFNQFRLLVPEYSALYALGLGTWSDNPNSYYLGILSELGLAGAFALIYCLSQLCWEKSGAGAGGFFRAAVAGLAVMLVVGPHLEFAEVSLLTALTFGYAVRLKGKRGIFYGRLASVTMLFLCAALLMKVAIAGSNFGFYALENDESGKFRWTGIVAARTLPCKSGEMIRLGISAVNPDLDARPVVTQLKIRGKGDLYLNEEITLQSAGAVQVIAFECPANNLDFFKTGNAQVRVAIRNSRAWSPRSYGLGEDPRLLGVKMIYQY